MLPDDNAGTWLRVSQLTAPAKIATGNKVRPWNSRTPFQIMPQATKSNADGNSRGKGNNGVGALHKANDEAPIK